MRANTHKLMPRRARMLFCFIGSQIALASRA
jgi:hypothetical protein